jgi:serine/threonine protein kinase
MHDDPTEISSERWGQIENLFHAALQVQASDREEFLTQACASDESLLREVLSLISCSDNIDSFMEDPALSLGLTVIGMQQEEMLGKHVARYKILKVLGYGGMGEVYLAHDPRLNRQVALKLLPISITGDRDRVLRFEQEARAASAISHPNVAHIYEIGEAQERHYITMEYVAGQTLRQKLRQGALETTRTLDIIIQILTALSSAHEVGVIHRDIKPENIMLRDDGYVKMLDFGLAKLIEGSSANSEADAHSLSSLHTEPGLMMGTSHYMSPEQVRRQPVDARTDVWSAGVVLYEMLTGQRPFQGEAISEIIIAILEQQPEPLSHKRSEMPLALQHILDKALCKQPDERYKTVDGMLRDLRAVSRQVEESQSLQDSPAHLTRQSSNPAQQEYVPNTAELRDPKTVALEPSNDELPFDKPRKRSPAIDSRPFFSQYRRSIMIAAPLLLLLITGVYFGLPYLRRSKLQSKAFNLQYQRLNLSGSITDINISPDGKYVTSIIAEEGKQAIHITELATSSDLRITPPSEKGYSGLSFSPDGNYVYYLENEIETASLHRVSKLGGAQRKILDNINSPATFSPDGLHIAFVRFNIPENSADLIIAQADGLAERTLSRRTRKDADLFSIDENSAGLAWSPDGKLLACVTVKASRGSQEMNIELLDVESGNSHRLNLRPWYDISRISWLADGSGLIVAAMEVPTTPWQLALVSFPGGETRQITNGPNNYTRISTTSDSKLFLTLNIEENTSIWTIPLDGEKQFTTFDVGPKKGVSDIAWKPDGKLIYTAYEGDNLNLWLEAADRKSARQLTFESNKNYRPTISPDERYVVFVSTRAGGANLWRMDMDGMHLQQLTSGTSEDMPAITPDGKWIIYRTRNNIQKVSIDGGTPHLLLNKPALYPVISPDGEFLAFFTNDKPDSPVWYLDIYELNSLAIVNRIQLSEVVKPFSGLSWTLDGKSLIYVSLADGAENLWVQPLKGGAPRPLTQFRDAEIISFNLSTQLKQIAFVRNTKTFIPVLIRPF